jgi:hypothetical protein
MIAWFCYFQLASDFVQFEENRAPREAPFLWRFWIRDYRREPRTSNQLALIAFVVLQILMVALIASFLSSFENDRYRFPTDPLYLALAGVLLTKILRRLHFSMARGAANAPNN